MKDKSRISKTTTINLGNKLIRKHTDELRSELNDLLEKAGLWYGDCPDLMGDVDTCEPFEDRNADLWVQDGWFDKKEFSVKEWLHTENDVRKAIKESKGIQ